MNDFREYDDYLMHYGHKGMKWGENRFQDDDNKNGHQNGSTTNQYNPLDGILGNLNNRATELEQKGAELQDLVYQEKWGQLFDMYRTDEDSRMLINSVVGNEVEKRVTDFLTNAYSDDERSAKRTVREAKSQASDFISLVGNFSLSKLGEYLKEHNNIAYINRTIQEEKKEDRYHNGSGHRG